jgi:hypothetical protein
VVSITQIEFAARLSGRPGAGNPSLQPSLGAS